MKKIRLGRDVPQKSLAFFRTCLKAAFLFLLFAAHPAASAQNGEQRFSLKIENAYLNELFLLIEKQSDYSFVYDADDVRALGKKNFRCVNSKLTDILDKCFDQTPLKYKIDAKHVIISRRDGSVRGGVISENVTVTGLVTDAGREPLAGVSVMVKGHSFGTSTDAAGRYTLRAQLSPEELREMVVVYSFVGMETREVKYTGQKHINIILKEKAGEIGAVVVQTGYQTIDRRKNTSAITSIKAQDILIPGAVTIDQMLEGRVPGMTFMQNSGQVGVAPKLRIRGTSTILGSQEPLWVIDGIPQSDPVNVDPSQLNDLDFVNLLGNAISGVNPEDIEQIDILKDAAATAIYGTRAANGVIVVTTKKGKAGPPQVNYSASVTFARRPHYGDKFVNMMDSRERVAFSRQLIESNVAYPYVQSWVGYEAAIKDYWEDRISFSEMRRRVSRAESLNTDWFDLLTRNSWSQKHTVSLSGGSSTMKYYVSLGLNDARGNIRGEKDKTYTANANLTANFGRFGFRFGMNASTQDKDYTPSSVNVLGYAYNTSRALEAYNEDGTRHTYLKPDYTGKNTVNFNILDELDNTWQEIRTTTASFNTTLDYRILEGLKAGVTLSYSMDHTGDQSYFGANSYRGQYLSAGGPENVLSMMPSGGELLDNSVDRRAYMIRAQIDYNTTLDKDGDHSLSAALGGEISSNRYTSWSQTYRGYEPGRGRSMNEFDRETYDEYYRWLQTDRTAKGVRSISLTNLASAYLTVSYDYKNRYMLNANMRIDGSNQFGSRANEKILPVWSFSGRWNIKNDLMERSRWLDALSLQASVGIQGNMLSSESSEIIIRRGPINSAFNEYGSTVASYPNPDLRWEKTTSTNLMLDFSLFGGRIVGNVNYFYKKTKDAFLPKIISSVNGPTSYTVNSGTIQNQGLELSFSFTPINRITRERPNGFRWTIAPQLSRVMNELHSSDGATDRTSRNEFTYDDYLNGSIEIPGRSLNSFYSYRFAGLDGTDGRPLFHNIGSDKEALYNTMSKDEVFQQVMVYSGRRVPVIQGSILNSFSWMRFTLSVNLAYSLGSKVRLLSMYPNVSGAGGTIAPQPEENVRKEFGGRWMKPGDEARTNIPGVLSGSAFENTLGAGNWWYNKPYVFADNIWQMYDNSDLRVASGDYLRLQSLSLRYNIPQPICNRLRLKTAYVGFAATNLFVICDSKLKGQDPTTQSGSSTVLNMSYRPTYSFNLNISF